MTPTADPKIYDEDSVFNRLFSQERPPRRPTKAERMARIFADAPSNESAIKVSDFLPDY